MIADTAEIMGVQNIGIGTDLCQNQPDSVYINNALDSIIQNGQMLNIEYALQSYGKGFKNIIYKRRYVDKIIDTVVVAPVKNILPKFLNRIVYRLPKSAIDHNLIEEMEKKKSLIMNKYYFISRKPDINIITSTISID